MTFAEILAEKGAEAGLSFTPLQLEQFSRYYELLVETNKVMNLTAITEPEEVAVKHMVDSLLAYEAEMAGKTLADVGTGAGFPGVPLKIYCPELKVTLIDSLGKRLRFLQQVIEELGLKGIRCEHLRAEDAGRDKKHREKYELCNGARGGTFERAERILPAAGQKGWSVYRPEGQQVCGGNYRGRGCGKNSRRQNY